MAPDTQIVGSHFFFSNFHTLKKMKSLETILAKQNFDDLQVLFYSPKKQTVLLEASKATVDYLVNFSKSALPCKWITGIFSTYEEIK